MRRRSFCGGSRFAHCASFHDEEEESVQDRVITASLTMIQKSKKGADLTIQLMRFYAVFPEDVPVPTAVLTSCVPSIIMEANPSGKTGQATKTALTVLLKYNLLKGGLAEGSGTFMHDIVRDYVISKHTDEELKALQHQVVKALLDARPEGGFPTAQHSAATTFEGYVARHLFWHIKGALAGDEPPMEWVDHRQDLAVRQAVALAVGVEALVKMAEAKEKKTDIFGAAEVVWCACELGALGRISTDSWNDLCYRTADLLAEIPEEQKDDVVSAFELEALQACWMRDMGSSRNRTKIERLSQLQAADQGFDAKIAEVWPMVTKGGLGKDVYPFISPCLSLHVMNINSFSNICLAFHYPLQHSLLADCLLRRDETKGEFHTKRAEVKSVTETKQNKLVRRETP